MNILDNEFIIQQWARAHIHSNEDSDVDVINSLVFLQFQGKLLKIKQVELLKVFKSLNKTISGDNPYTLD